MKKVLSVIMVMAILLTSAVSVFADGGTKFIKHDWGQALTEDGRLYSVSKSGATLIDTDVVDFTSGAYIKKDAYIYYYRDINDRKSSFKEAHEPDYYAILGEKVVQDENGNIFQRYPNNSVYDKELLEDQTNGTKIIKSGDYHFLTEDNALYRAEIAYNGNLTGLTKLADNVKDFRDGYFGDTFCYYRDMNDNLYYYKGNWQDPTLFLSNCSEIYSDDGFDDGFAKTNDGKWYHWGSNDGFCLEPEKLVDGNNITPMEIKTPMIASEYVYQFKCKVKKDIYKTITWALDGGLYIDGEKIADNVVNSFGNTKYITDDGDIIYIETTPFEYKIFDTNFADVSKHTYEGIDTEGNLVFYNEYEGVKKIYANHKYLNRSDWADAEIALADEIGYIDSVKLFDMQSNIKREDFCNMIVDFCEKYLGRELSTTSNPFKDTKNEKVIKAYANGIITGVSSDKFAPDDRITREQMCAIMTRATKFLKSDVQFGEGIKFSDMYDVSDWAVEGVNATSGLGIVKGDGVSITPKANTSVEQAIAMTYRLYNKIK